MFKMLKIFWEKLLEMLLPQNHTVKLLINMRAEELLKRTRRPKKNLHEDNMALFDYKDPLIRQAIWELKYRGNKKIAALLGECLYGGLVLELSNRKLAENFDNPLLLPIPISGKKRRSRGWNQTEILADNLNKRSGGNFFEVNGRILIKIKDTISQTMKNRAERIKNLNGSFAVKNPEAVRGRNIILLDDVATTGATFEEAKKTLLSAGAKKIICVAVAH